MRLVTVEEMRRLDRLTIGKHGIPGIVLMERAGAAVTEAILSEWGDLRRQRVVVVAGRGNNGGDGFVIARLLRRAGVRAEVVLLASIEEVGGDAALALTALRRAKVPLVEMREKTAGVVDRLAKATVIVDAIFGTGLRSAITGLAAEVIEAMNESGRPIVAVDLPSGLDGDSGRPLGPTIRATTTVSLGFAKRGQVLPSATPWLGRLTVADIGLAPEAVESLRPSTWLSTPEDLRPLLPPRPLDSHKGTFGHVLVLAGSVGHSGAARLAAHAAARGGAGLVTLAVPASLQPVVSAGVPEVMTAALAESDGLVRFSARLLDRLCDGKQAVVVGPGLGTHAAAAKVVDHVLDHFSGPLVLDADALTCLARQPKGLAAAPDRCLLTPHPGEMARLLGVDTATIQKDRLAAARQLATRHRCFVILKGARSVIASPEGEAWVNPTGNPGMASGGMGDALSGLLGALLAQGLSGEAAARLGAFLHGAAADHLAVHDAPWGYLATDVIHEIPRAAARLAAGAAGHRIGTAE